MTPEADRIWDQIKDKHYRITPWAEAFANCPEDFKPKLKAYYDEKMPGWDNGVTAK